MLSREQMIERIKGGKSVLYKNRIITSVDKLPTAAQMASTDAEKEAAADDLKTQMQKMQAQLDELEAGKKDSSVDKNSENSGAGDDDQTDTFKSLMKLNHEDLVTKAKAVAKDKGIEFDPKAPKATLSRFILGEEEPAE
jgi:hypothetical protein